MLDDIKTSIKLSHAQTRFDDLDPLFSRSQKFDNNGLCCPVLNVGQVSVCFPRYKNDPAVGGKYNHLFYLYILNNEPDSIYMYNEVHSHSNLCLD